MIPSVRDRRGAICAGLLTAIGFVWSPTASGHVPPNPSQEMSSNRTEGTDERLRKLEEMNRQLLLRFEGVAKQNEVLSQQVKDLNRRLETKPTSTSKPDSAVTPVAAPPGSSPTDVTAPIMEEVPRDHRDSARLPPLLRLRPPEEPRDHQRSIPEAAATIPPRFARRTRRVPRQRDHGTFKVNAYLATQLVLRPTKLRLPHAFRQRRPRVAFQRAAPGRFS